ncbi:neuroligin-1-like [Homarus americanus]|uniref:neuroligin-1-like n=1 Tax=Homarus americanus TaxID=6706 RepID=UPI001C488763|nr:neuroligin-1-like [Homarus americanus]
MMVSAGRAQAGLVATLVVMALAVTHHDAHAARTTRNLSPRMVRTKYGTLRGLIVNLGVQRLGDAEVFLSVPYASPPIGNLRFMPPGSPSPWREVKIVDHLGPVCPQRLPDIRNETEALKKMSRGRYQYLRRLLPYLRNQSEDCLYLNIYTPAGGSEEEMNKNTHWRKPYINFTRQK